MTRLSQSQACLLFPDLKLGCQSFRDVRWTSNRPEKPVQFQASSCL